MRNVETWRPSKYILEQGRLRASRSRREVGIGSRLTADLLAGAFGAALPLHARGRLLDLGCGKVPLFEAYRPYVESVTCVDWAHSLHGNEHSDIECNLTQPIPLPDRCFDTVILSDVLEHIPEPEALMVEIARVLAPGGKLLLTVPFMYWLHEQPHDYYRYTRHALTRFAELTQLDVVELRPVGGAFEVIVDVASKNLLRFGRPGRWIAHAVQWAALRLSATRAFDRMAQATGAEFPLCYFLVAQRPGNDRVASVAVGVTA